MAVPVMRWIGERIEKEMKMKKGEQELRAMKSKIAEYEAALRTISKFGGTVQQARDLAGKVLTNNLSKGK